MSLKRRAKVCISISWYAVDVLGQWCMRLFLLQRPGRFVVLYYHGVPDALRARFARQMDMVLRSTHAVPANYSGPLKPGELYVAITFDDAFNSVGVNAVPEIVKRSLPATIFVPSNLIGCVAEWQMDAEAQRCREGIMSREQLRNIRGDLISIGSHTANHARLTEIDDERLRDELKSSRQSLEEVFGAAVPLLSFPYGAYDTRVIFGCRDAGYRQVFTTEPRCAGRTGEEFVRGRVSADPRDSYLEFFLKLRGGYSWMVIASGFKRRISKLTAGAVTFLQTWSQRASEGFGR